MSTPPQPMDGHDGIDRDRFPTLFETLSRKTVAPLDLFSFYIYMRDQQRSVDYLDFWLDVSQHLQLCRLYVRQLHRSLVEQTPDLERIPSRSPFLDQFIDHDCVNNYQNDVGEGPSNNEKTMNEDQRLSMFIRGAMGSRNHSPQNSQGSNDITATPHRSSLHVQESPIDSSSPGQVSSADPSQPGKEDLRASAEKILYTYLLPGSEREIIIPQSILNEVQEAIEGPEQRADPELFEAAKDYVFQAMERDAFPGFLQNKGLGNLIPQSMMLRLIIGLVAFFAGTWTAFCLIFMGYSRTTRCWLILPFTVAMYCFLSHQFMLDPLLAFIGYSEYTLFDFNKIKEKYVRRMLYRRSMTMLLWFVLFTAGICLLFIMVPSKRL